MDKVEVGCRRGNGCRPGAGHGRMTHAGVADWDGGWVRHPRRTRERTDQGGCRLNDGEADRKDECERADGRDEPMDGVVFHEWFWDGFLVLQGLQQT